MKTVEQNKIIGERLKSARMQLNFSRREFAKICGFSAATLQAWEDGKYPVPKKSIIKYVEALFNCGLITTPEWFINGAGLPPRPYSKNQVKTTSKNERVLKEILFFEKENEDSIIVSIPDNSMLPFYDEGDFVGGIVVSEEQIKKYLGSVCIVTLSTGETLVRKLKAGTMEQSYNLISTNLDTDTTSAFILNCKIDQIAQVVWHRKIEHE